ncbi:hypothetical protein HYC85_013052 [Camellia sinensis]|uniref:Polygalacturonase n=1 Tax=Camellia sinensis TaxID=4442 RepID=A0A7J7HE85_CAMSI|nr:hypothetical protein HYC85_013052 [Camellia sinensis]
MPSSLSFSTPPLPPVSATSDRPPLPQFISRPSGSDGERGRSGENFFLYIFHFTLEKKDSECDLPEKKESECDGGDRRRKSRRGATADRSHENGASATPTYNVVSLGARGDGKTDSSKAFLSAWDGACGSAYPATIYGPLGRLTSLNSQMFHIVINSCNNVKLQGVKVSAARNNPNTDGIHVAGSSGVTILSSKIATGDDCISVGPGTTNLWIESIACGPGHSISIGSLGKDSQESGMQNVLVKTVTFTGTQNGLRIKTWAKPSSGFVRGVLFQHGTMVIVQNPVIIDQNYCPGNTNCPNQVSGVKISDVTYQDIHGTSATEVAVNFACSAFFINKVLFCLSKKKQKKGSSSFICQC